MAKLSFASIIDYVGEERRLLKAGKNAFMSGHVLHIKLNQDNNEYFHLRGRIQASMRNKTYECEVDVNDDIITSATCTCPRGKYISQGKYKCHHIVAMLVHVSRNATNTDVQCSLRGKLLPRKPAAIAEGLWPPTDLHYTAISRPVTDADKAFLRDNLSDMNVPTGFLWLLAPEPEPDRLPVPTFDMIVLKPSVLNIQARSNAILKELCLTADQINAVAELTKDQSETIHRRMYGRGRLLASNFGRVLSAVGRNSYPPTILKFLFGEYNSDEMKAIRWQKKHKTAAVGFAASVAQKAVTHSGIWLHSSGVLGASPDGFIGEDIVVVYCPFNLRVSSLQQAVHKDKDFCVGLENGTFSLKSDHDYYHQVQGQLYMTNRNVCHFVVWTPSEALVIPVTKNLSWKRNLDVLLNFYQEQMLPKLLEQLL